MSEPELINLLPAGVALSWGLAPASTRGPKPGMSVPQIVTAAMAIADEGGLAAVSMKSVADRLGFTAMSLYRYLSSKEDLLILMLDAGFGPVPEKIAAAQGWRARCRAWSRAVYLGILERPWLADIPIGGAPMTYFQMRWLESALQALAETPLSGAEKLNTALTLSSLAMANARLTRDMRQGQGQDGAADVGRRFEEALLGLLPLGDFPELAPLVRGNAFSDGDDDEHEHFEFAMELVLDGVAHRVDASGAAG
ncbi:AcrR family transcriptional regulator [Psychromicrobium silvestre]|uniref:AcrR family transcriptional regulator n=1 Tax=Psychromicrobium silvestre TaxID=1645614 RepID=A0A7Y9LUY7_9MICC|nr:TetR/AcrR family transcriptional regulator [Psychromicrobium silvestre]NYE96076.1 AcrR family transcriptional regulator [Psychromicrobium silvestre]